MTKGRGQAVAALALAAALSVLGGCEYCGAFGAVFLEDGTNFRLLPPPPWAEPQATQAAELWEHIEYALEEISDGVQDVVWHVCVQLRGGRLWARIGP